MKKILIIENEFKSIMAPIMVLEGKYKEEQDGLEYEVQVKSQDVNWSRIDSYNAVFVDLSLAAKTEMDGFAILNMIKKDYPSVVYRTAIITGNGMVEDALNAKGIGADEFVIFTKPLKYMSLKEFIDKVSPSKAEEQE